MRSLYRTVPALAFALTLLSITATAQEATSYAELPRFKQVHERLYRSAQPRAGGIKRLHELGFNTIINLRGASARTRAQEVEARALGLNYHNLSLPNWGRPKDARVARIIEIISARESGRVLIHCRSGVDRTGMIVAIHRMQNEGWTSKDALAEAERDGMRRIQFWMRDYAEDYGSRVQQANAENAGQAQDLDDEDFGDRLGEGMRIAERETFRARKIGGRFLRKVLQGFDN
ncbi:MAG TPA: sulfur transferase domain-containing protein [Pyrinomonadaceae bacterium]|nr:sulfur transferase domain-containing protein [Pyrinomonadaceae bacterium]